MRGDEDLEREGSSLWNLCTRLNREVVADPGKNSARSKLLLRGRLLAFQILHLCQWSSKGTSSVARHLLRLALKVAKFCIGLFLVTISFTIERHVPAHSTSAFQMTTTFRLPGSCCRELRAILADCRTCLKKRNIMPASVRNLRPNGQSYALPW